MVCFRYSLTNNSIFRMQKAHFWLLNVLYTNINIPMLRLARDAWSTVIRLKQTTNVYTPPPSRKGREVNGHTPNANNTIYTVCTYWIVLPWLFSALAPPSRSVEDRTQLPPQAQAQKPKPLWHHLYGSCGHHYTLIVITHHKLSYPLPLHPKSIHFTRQQK